MTEQPTVHQPAASTRPSRTAWAAYAACALALLSAIPSFYWAAGGTIGLNSVGGAIEELARARELSGGAQTVSDTVSCQGQPAPISCQSLHNAQPLWAWAITRLA